MIARTIRIEGRVQGVFFRDWTVRAAQALGLSGWVRNRTDGSVEVFAVGEADLVERLQARLREGPDDARVDRIVAEEAPVHAVDGFTKWPTA